MLQNPHRFNPAPLCPAAPFPSIAAAAPLALLARCPDYCPTPLHAVQIAGYSAQFHIKDERTRMGLGSFKALGAAYVIADMAQTKNLKNTIFATASAGNHGLSVAKGAQIFGAKAVIFLSATVPENFANRLTALGAEVRRAGQTYEQSMQAAADISAQNNWILLSDSSWEEYIDLPHKLMEGYLVLAHEITETLPPPPTHIFLQAGVGGLAGACAAYFRHAWPDTQPKITPKISPKIPPEIPPKIIVVEPATAPALHHSIQAARPLTTVGETSIMGRLDCKTPSLIALNGLARDADEFMLVGDEIVMETLKILDAHALSTTASGGAGLVASLLHPASQDLAARILVIISEESVDERF